MIYARDENVQELASAFGVRVKEQRERVDALEPHVAAIRAREAYPSLAQAVAANPGRSVLVNSNDQSLPANFAGVLLEYTAEATARSIDQKGWWPDKAMRTLRSQHKPGHPDQKHSTLNIETLASGSGKNGPFSADYGVSINVAKKDFATGAAVSGEIDGLTIYVRQDGARGLPSSDPGTSDACGILINVQNVEDVGFVAPIEAVSSNIQGSAPYGIRRSIGAQMAPITANQPGGMVSYGHVVMSTAGDNDYAYYAGVTGGTWDYLFYSPDRMSITGDGEYRILTPDWQGGALQIMRGRGQNDASMLFHRGLGPLMLMTAEAASIQFVTANVERLRVRSDGHFVPATGQTINLGDPGARFASAFLTNLNTSGEVTLADLPTTNPGVSGRLWRDAANGNVLKVSP